MVQIFALRTWPCADDWSGLCVFVLFPIFVQVYNSLPLQKLSGYSYEVEDNEQYPCLTLPEPEPELEKVPNLEAANRAKRSMYFEPPNEKNDVYSIFKV